MTWRVATNGLRLGALLIALGAACATPPPSARSALAPPTLALARCRGPRPIEGTLCGIHPVFEDRAARTGRMILLKVIVVPARVARPARDPVIFLMGGPGVGAASVLTKEMVDHWRPMGRDRDLVFVDQRGTGGSGPLRCRLSSDASAQSGFEDLLPVDRIRACRQALEPSADLRLYTTPIATDDLDEVRAALGYEAINIWAISCGGMAALHRRGVPSRLSRVAAGSRRRARPVRWRPGDFRVAWHLRRPGRARPDIARRVRRAPPLDRLEPASRVPLVIHRASREDWLPFARATRPTLGAGSSSAFPVGMYLTVTCSESVPRITESDIVRETRGTFVGEYRTRVHVRACQEWPRGTIPPEYDAPVASSVPVLILSGALDPADDAAAVRAAARALSNSRQVLIRNAAHDYSAACLRDLATDFIDKGSARELDTRCVEQMRRPAFVTE